MPITAQTLINNALRQIKVLRPGQTPSTDESNLALDQMNAMLSTWSQEQWFVYVVSQYTAALTAAKGTYTIGGPGAGADFDTARPIKVVDAEVQITFGGTPIRYPLSLLRRDEYMAIMEPNATAQIPRSMYYDNNTPLSSIFLWPVPAGTPTLILGYWQNLAGQMVNLTDTFTMPPQYQRAIEYNLAIDLAPQYPRTELDQATIAQAKDALDAIKRFDLAMQAADLEFPRGTLPEIISPASNRMVKHGLPDASANTPKTDYTHS